MKKIFTILLLVFLYSNPALALNNCKDFPSGKNSVSCNDAGEIDIYDGIECLFELSNYFPTENSKGILSYFDTNIKPNVEAAKYYGVFSDTWAYKLKDGEGVSGECRSRFPSINERMYIKRLPSDDNALESKFIVGRDYCWTRKVLGATGYYHCGWKETDDDEPYEGRWGDNYQATFDISDVDTNAKTLRGTAYGHQVCLKRTAKYKAFTHNADSKNPGPRNKVCAYVVQGLSCDSYWGLDPASALIGCVDEPLLPGPDVFNSVIPSEIAPKVDNTICLTKDDSGSSKKGCNNNKESLVDRGSTFDKPMVVVTDGVLIKDENGNVTGNAKELELRYQFYNDDYRDSIKSCGQIAMPGFDNITYCAQVPLDDPSVVCACERDKDFGMPKSDEQINFCGTNKVLGCSPRPRLADSNLTIASESKVYVEPKTGVEYIAAQISFVDADKNGRPIYRDKDDNLACYNLLDKKYYKCDSSGQLSNTLSKLPLNGFKKRLIMPINNDSSYYIREYFPNTSIPPYSKDKYSAKGDASCKDKNDDDVYYGFDGNFYLLDNKGKVTSDKAKGEVKCKVKDGKDTFKFSSETKSREPNNNNEITTEPNGYVRENKKFYGINFGTMIPAFNADGSVMFLRYQTAQDAILPMTILNIEDPIVRAQKVAEARACIPITNTKNLCSSQGITSFVPGGDRDRDYCQKVPDQNNDNKGYPDNNPKCAPLGRGANDTASMKTFCPGVLKVSTSGSGDRVCLEASAGEWNFKKKPEVDLFGGGQDCAKPIMDADAYCSPVAGALTVPAVTTPSQNSGWTTWPAAATNSTQTGTCDLNLGYVMRNDVRLIVHTKAEICSYNRPVSNPLTGQTCDDVYSLYLGFSDLYQKDLTKEVGKIADKDVRNLKLNEIVAIPVLLMAYFQDNQMVQGRDYTLQGMPPVRTIDADGKAEVTNGCVRVN